MGSKRNKIFLGITFTVTWISWWLLSYLTQAGVIEFQNIVGQLLFVIGGSGPTVSAYVAVVMTKKDGSLNEFNSRVLKVKVKPMFYIFSIFTPIALGLLGLGLVSIIDNQYLLQNPLNPMYLFITAFLVSIVLGGVEEFGWRGVLQPALTRRLNLIVANCIIGIIWGLWHLPLFYVAGAYHQGNSFFLFTLAGIGYSSFLTWLYAKTNSIFLCVLFHAAINATASIGLSVSMSDAAFLYSAVFVFVAGILFLLLLPKYRPEFIE